MLMRTMNKRVFALMSMLVAAVHIVFGNCITANCF